MGRPGSGEAAPPTGSGAPARTQALAALDQSLMRARRLMVKPPTAELPVPALGRQVDLAKVLACEALADLAEPDGAVTVKEVAVALGLDQSTVSRLLGEAEAEGLVDRGKDPDDGRRTTVRLSEQGRILQNHSVSTRQEMFGALLADWSVEDMCTLAALMSRLTDAVQRAKENGTTPLPPTAV
jgi:DNA-binding MarR family transcriptional regulator